VWASLRSGVTPCRIAYVRYLNTAPLVEGLSQAAGVTLMPAAPARIAGMVLGGQADLGLASIVDAVGADLSIVPAGMIGSEGATLTVRLFSRVPPARIARLHADAESHTSVVLARLLLDRVYGCRPEVVPLEEPSCEAGEAVLLIGDKAVLRAPDAERYPHTLDLGRAWHDLTGLPFVYAAWVCRRGEEGGPAVRLAGALVDRQRRRNRLRLGWIAATRGRGANWPPGLAEEYLGGLMRYDLGERERRGLRAFVGQAVEAGLLASAELAFAS
jgi:chorismate dehydratase